MQKRPIDAESETWNAPLTNKLPSKKDTAERRCKTLRHSWRRDGLRNKQIISNALPTSLGIGRAFYKLMNSMEAWQMVEEHHRGHRQVIRRVQTPAIRQMAPLLLLGIHQMSHFHSPAISEWMGGEMDQILS